MVETIKITIQNLFTQKNNIPGPKRVKNQSPERMN